MRRRALLTVAAAFAVIPASAQGGTYEVLACDAAPGGLNRAWTSRSTSPNLPAYARCPARGSRPLAGGLITRNSPSSQNRTAFNRPGTFAAQEFEAPRRASIVGLSWAGYRLHRGYPDGAGYEVGVIDDSLRWRDAHCSGRRWCADRSTPSTMAFERVPRHHVAVPHRRRLAFMTICQGQGGRPCLSRATGDSASADLVAGIIATWVRVRVSDTTRPTLTELAGPLWRTGSHRGRRAIRFRASDNVGIRKVQLLVDGRSEASRASSCDFTRRTPCPSPGRSRILLDTRALRDGRHALALQVTDAAGNVAVARRTISIANGGSGQGSDDEGSRRIVIGALFALGLLLEVLAVILFLRKRRRRSARPTPPPASPRPASPPPASPRPASPPPASPPPASPRPASADPKPDLDDGRDTERPVELDRGVTERPVELDGRVTERPVELPSPLLGPDDRQKVRERIAARRAEGMTLQAIANELNDEGVPTLRGGTMWRPSSVQSAAGYRRPRPTGSVAASERDKDAGQPGAASDRRKPSHRDRPLPR